MIGIALVVLLEWCLIRQAGYKTTAACIEIQNEIGKKLLWAAYRHHVGEIVLTYVWDHLKIKSISRSKFLYNASKIALKTYTTTNPRLIMFLNHTRAIPQASAAIAYTINISLPLSGDIRQQHCLFPLYLAHGNYKAFAI